MAQLSSTDIFGSLNVTGATTLSSTVANGNVVVNGVLSKSSGSFKIDHPLKKDTHYLVHSFIEGPRADLIYRGKVALSNGRKTINLDEEFSMTEGTFIALNANTQCLVMNETGWDKVRGMINGNILTIESENNLCSDVISWIVIGERHDEHMMNTEWTDENGRVITEVKKYGE